MSSENGKVRYDSLALALVSLRTKLTGAVDLRRWGSLDNFEREWDGRSELIATLVKPGSTVIDFGAGRRQLESLLPPSCTYLASDIVERGPDTLVIDLNRRPLPDLSAVRPDVAIFAGVFEYLIQLDSLMTWLREQVSACVLSYGCIDRQAGLRGYLDELRRLRYGWVNAMSEADVVRLFEDAGFRLRDRRLWETPTGSEVIFGFRR